MANEITWDTVTGLTINVYRFKMDDNVLLANPASNEVWGTDGHDASNYAIVMSESGSSGHYSVDFNDGGAIAAGVYRIVYALQAGVNPIDGDRKIAKGEIQWDGTAEIVIEVMRGTDSAITSLNPITTDKNSYKATGFNIVTPDAAGIAAALHGITNGKVDGLNNITVAEILAGVVEGTITLVQVQRLAISVLAGLASGGDTTSIKFRNLANTKNRVTFTVDSNGNRTSVTLDLT